MSVLLIFGFGVFVAILFIIGIFYSNEEKNEVNIGKIETDIQITMVVVIMEEFLIKNPKIEQFKFYENQLCLPNWLFTTFLLLFR